MAKISKKWIALCSTAIGAIYTAGYYTTEPQANALLAQPAQQIQQIQQPERIEQINPTPSAQPAQQKQQVQPTPSAQPAQQKQQVQSTPSAQPAQQKQQRQPPPSTQPAQPTQVVQTKGIYKDGTYNGIGSNRRGSIQVDVTIKNDKITDVEISHFAMHYSERDVVGLPNEVLQKQSALVNNVSGATYSTQAFQDAIKDALSQGRNS